MQYGGAPPALLKGAWARPLGRVTRLPDGGSSELDRKYKVSSSPQRQVRGRAHILDVTLLGACVPPTTRILSEIFGKQPIGGSGVQTNASMHAVLEDRDVTWQELQGRGEILNSSSSSSRSIFGAISDLVVLPEISGDQQDTRVLDDTVNSNTSRANRRGNAVPAGHTTNRTSGDDTKKSILQPQKIGVSGGRAVLATRAVYGVPGSTTGLGILEHGFGLDTTAEGNIGLPEGSTLFAQRAPLGGEDRYHEAQPTDRSLNGGSGGTTGRRRGNKEVNWDNTTQERHVLLFSDRVRSKTNIMVVSSDGEVAPAVTGANKVCLRH